MCVYVAMCWYRLWKSVDWLGAFEIACYLILIHFGFSVEHEGKVSPNSPSNFSDNIFKEFSKCRRKQDDEKEGWTCTDFKNTCWLDEKHMLETPTT